MRQPGGGLRALHSLRCRQTRRDTATCGPPLVPAPLLFEKIEDEVIQAQIDKLLATKKANELKQWVPDPVKAETTFEDFEKTDIRVGKVVECSKVKKSEKAALPQRHSRLL